MLDSAAGAKDGDAHHAAARSVAAQVVVGSREPVVRPEPHADLTQSSSYNNTNNDNVMR